MKPSCDVQYIVGGQWVVEVARDKPFVIKRPRNPRKDTARELFDRHRDAIQCMQGYYDSKEWGKVPVPDMELVEGESAMRQEKIVGRRLADIEDDTDILLLHDDSLEDLARILECTMAVRSSFGILGDFIDLPGINNELPVMKRLARSVKSRYSTNIMVGEEDRIALIDPDWAIASTRSPVNTASVILTKPLMLFHMRKFHELLRTALGYGEISAVNV